MILIMVVVKIISNEIKCTKIHPNVLSKLLKHSIVGHQPQSLNKDHQFMLSIPQYLGILECNEHHTIYFNNQTLKISRYRQKS